MSHKLRNTHYVVQCQDNVSVSLKKHVMNLTNSINKHVLGVLSLSTSFSSWQLILCVPVLQTELLFFAVLGLKAFVSPTYTITMMNT